MHNQANLPTRPFPGTKQELLNAMLTAFSESIFLFDAYERKMLFISQQLVGALGYPADTAT